MAKAATDSAAVVRPSRGRRDERQLRFRRGRHGPGQVIIAWQSSMVAPLVSKDGALHTISRTPLPQRCARCTRLAPVPKAFVPRLSPSTAPLRGSAQDDII